MKREIREVPTRNYWSRNSALNMWESMRMHFHTCGYLLAVYGSSVEESGRGRDLDMIAIPWRPTPVPPQSVMDHYKAVMIEEGEPYYGLMKTEARLYRMASGHLVDIQFYRPALSDCEEAYAWAVKNDEEQL